MVSFIVLKYLHKSIEYIMRIEQNDFDCIQFNEEIYRSK